MLMSTSTCNYGMVGLGTMGRNLVFNMCSHGYKVAGFDKDAKQVKQLTDECGADKVMATVNISDFVAAIQQPRTIMLLVPAGKIVDAVINELTPLLGKDDLIIDCGNSHYTDTNRRIAELEKQGLHFMGVGVSGGEEGARFGPSIMPGGNKEIYETRVAPVFNAIAAKVNGQPCVTYLGKGSAGHYVKMVHNGIEYGLMQLIAEAYHILKQYGNLCNAEMHEVFAEWNNGRLKSFLIEITADIFLTKDELTANDLLDMVLDTAHQKGTGIWTTESAMQLQVPIPVIDSAVTARYYSADKALRLEVSKMFTASNVTAASDKAAFVKQLEDALYFAFIITYTQGLSLLHKASEVHGYGNKASDIARIWKGGCIIRAELLETIEKIFNHEPLLDSMLLSKPIADILHSCENGTHTIAIAAIQNGIPIPALTAALGYYNSYKSVWLPANMVQAQRDYFGAHTYERNDREGVFHSKWSTKD